MVILLEGNSSTMLGSGPNQYIQPDYLGPLPSTLDSKQSPLALLAQTCSQIGSDTPSTKSQNLLDSSSSSSKRKSSTCSDASGSSSNNSEHSSRPKSSGSTSSINSNNKPITTNNGKSSPEGKSSPPTGFRPYEKESIKSGTSSSAVTNHNNSNSKSVSPSAKRSTPPLDPPKESSKEERKRHAQNSSSSSSESKKSRQDSGKSSPLSTAATSASASKDQGASPIIRSGLEVLQGNDYRRHGAAAAAWGLYPPHGPFDPSNPAFRPPFMPPSSFGSPFPPTGSPYIGYSRVKTASGSESIVPVCKDPYCTGCQFSGGSHGSQAAALMAAAAGFSPFHSLASPTTTTPSSVSGVSSSGATGFDPKIHFSPSPAGGLPLPPSFFPGYPPTSSPSSLSHPSPQSAAAASSRPHVCSWIVGNSYCGKSFLSSEELLQHLRTHPSTNGSSTNGSTEQAALLSAAMMHQQQAQAAAYSNLLAGYSRSYPTPPLSPLSAARYNPYAAAAMASAMASKGLFPPPPPSLAGLYSAAAAASSPYAALYGQKIPQVHP